MKIISDDPIVAFITLFFLVTAIIATVLYDIGKKQNEKAAKAESLAKEGIFLSLPPIPTTFLQKNVNRHWWLLFWSWIIAIIGIIGLFGTKDD